MSRVQRQRSLSSASTDHIDRLRMPCARQTSHHFNTASSVNGKQEEKKKGGRQAPNLAILHLDMGAQSDGSVIRHMYSIFYRHLSEPLLLDTQRLHL